MVVLSRWTVALTDPAPDVGQAMNVLIGSMDQSLDSLYSGRGYTKPGLLTVPRVTLR